MLKKLTAIFLSVTAVLSLAACGAQPQQNIIEATQMPQYTAPQAPTPTDAPLSTFIPGDNSISAEDLQDYTIVYPAQYNEYRMDIVNELEAVIEKITDSDIKVISDADKANEKLIILASTATEHCFKADIDAFDDNMDYIVGLDGENIILGGKNYYADLRAVYDFMRNVLGYDSVDGYKEETGKLDGTSYVYYQKPDFYIQAASWSPGFYKEEYVRDIAEANFNMTMAYATYYSKPQDMHNYTKWCAKYGLEILFHINSTENRIPNDTLIFDCPAVYGGYVYDEPYKDQLPLVESLCKDFEETYSKYGWKSYMNYGGKWDIEDFPHTKDTEMLSMDHYIFVSNGYDIDVSYHGEGKDYLKTLQRYTNAAEIYGQDLWTFIQSYQRAGGKINSSKAYRWQMYMNMCFNARAILYFMYTNVNQHDWDVLDTSVVNVDFSKGENYYSAQSANADVLKAYQIIKDYDYAGAYTINKRYNQQGYADFDEYLQFGVIADMIAPKNERGEPVSYLVGCFDKYSSSEKAFILMNLDLPNNEEYGKDNFEDTKIKLNGNNPKFYFEGELVELTPDAEGYYSLDISNGYSWVITVE